MSNRISRGKFHQALSEKNSQAFSELKAKADDKGLPFEAILRKECAGPETGAPENIIYDFMAREQMLPGSSLVRPAIKVEECINTPFRANLLFAHWDRLYNDTFWGEANRNGRPKTYVSTIDETEPGSIYRPYTEARNEILNRNRRTPDIALSQLIAQVITQSDDLVRGTGFTVDGSAGRLVVVPEREEFPEIAFTLDQNGSGMQKIGISLASSRESKLRESYVQTVDRVVQQVAQLQEQQLSIQAAKHIYDAHDATVNPRQGSVGENLSGIIQVNTSAKNGYRLDTLVMGLTQFRSWVQALVTKAASTANATQPGTENRVPGLFGSTEILNNLQNGSRIGYFQDDDLTTIGLAAGDMLGFDRGITLDFHQQAQGMVDEEEYMVKKQEWTRVISMIYGFRIFDRNSIQIFGT